MAGLGVIGMPELTLPALAQNEVLVPFTDLPDEIVLERTPDRRIIDQEFQGFVDRMHVHIVHLRRCQGRQIGPFEHVVIVDAIGLTGIEHDAVTVEGDDFQVPLHPYDLLKQTAQGTEETA